MVDIRATVQGAENIAKRIRTGREKALKAQDVAVRVEAYRLYKKLRHEVATGTPGGRPYSNPDLSAIASYTATGRPKRNQTPLARLVRLLRYDVPRGSKIGDITVRFGFIHSWASKMGRSGRRIAQVQQTGGRVMIKGSREDFGRRLARIGGRLKKRGDPNAKYFFLRKGTGDSMELPARDIVHTHWQANRQEALRRIRENFRRKLRGERI